MKVSVRGMAKCATTAAVVVLGALLIANVAHFYVELNVLPKLRFQCYRGEFAINVTRQHLASPLGLSMRDEREGISWGFWELGSSWAFVPLWALLAASVLAMGWAYSPNLWKRIVRTHCCPRCGYDRKGLAIGVPCPECGTPSSK